MSWLVSAMVFCLAMLGTPLFIVILAAAMLGYYYADINLQALVLSLNGLADIPLLVALPLFAFAGHVLAESGTSKRLVRVTQAFLGSFRSGIAIVALLICAFFTALTGASGVTIVALGGLLYPALKNSGYSDKFSLGLITSSGSLGLLLAPSLPLILYGIIVSQMDIDVEHKFAIQDLFIAGIMPVTLMIIMLSAWCIWVNRNSAKVVATVNLREIKAALWDARWELPLPFIVLGGIFSGYFVLSEAATVTVIYVLIVEVFMYKEVKLRSLPGIVRESMVVVGSILMILGVSLAFTNFLVDQEVPQKFFEFIRTYVDSKWVFLALMTILLLLVGAILDIFSALVILVPLLLPVALEFDIHPIHLGIVFLANMQIGYFTPPVGMNLFIASYRFKKPITVLYKSCLPFMLILISALLIITYVPWLSLALIE